MDEQTLCAQATSDCLLAKLELAASEWGHPVQVLARVTVFSRILACKQRLENRVWASVRVEVKRSKLVSSH